MANSLVQQGAQSATFTVPTVSGGDGPVSGSLTVTDWAVLPSGKCKSLFNKAYLAGAPAVPSLAAFFDAYAAAGGMTVLVAVDGDAIVNRDAQWTLDEAGYPVLDDSAAGAELWQARISVSYSASE